MTTPRKAVALLSGGLDSMLAVRVILDQGIPVTAIRYITHFGCDPVSAGSCGHDVEPLLKLWGHLGLEVKMSHLGQDYIEMVKAPKHGRGRNMNPCVDCRIMMLGRSREFLERHGAGFLITGEVLNQRPMSQTYQRFKEIDRELGLEGYVVRPLSAKLLPPTLPEQEGVIDRSRLLMLSGRGRNRQYEMAKEFGIDKIPQPSGGCLLTDPGYSDRLRDLWAHDPDGGARDINLLRIGRHFRVSPACKIIVGRNERENGMIETFAGADDLLVRVRDHVGPVTVIRGEAGEAAIEKAAMLTARYADVPDGADRVAVCVATRTGEVRILTVAPAVDAEFKGMRVGVR
jgi:tRNA U34 2-thiouridine synthase MnmA/TrmU